MGYQLPHWVQSAIVVLIACMAMVGIVVSALAIVRVCQWLEDSVPKFRNSRRKRKVRLRIEEERNQEVKKFSDALEDTLKRILSNPTAETKRPFDEERD